MRVSTIAVVVMMMGLPALAQPRPQELIVIERYAARLSGLSAQIKRDAFIVAQIVQGLGELKGFQKNVALSKALDRVQAAEKKGGEDPKASIFTMTAISKVKDAVKHAQTQGTTADLEGLRRQILEQTHYIQQELFKELDLARKERMALVDAQLKLAQITTDMDGAMSEALGSTFDFFRAGGQ